MKWRHSKEAQAQKDKEKDEKGEKSLSESGGREPKEPLESECESEGRSDCESDEAGEESADGHLDISEHNKPSVIMSGSAPASSTETAATDTAASQVLIWGRRAYLGHEQSLEEREFINFFLTEERQYVQTPRKQYHFPLLWWRS